MSVPIPVLRIADLGVSVSSGAKVLTSVDLEIGAGKILGVIGESGAGKSMIGAAIADTLPAPIVITGGSIHFDGQDLLAMPATRRRALLGREVGFIPQEPMTALNPSLTIGRQVTDHLARIGLRGRANRLQRAVSLLEEVGLREPGMLLGYYPHQLSGGMLQRVLIAMAFASNPKLVIADEPTTALDVTIQARVVELIVRMRDIHRTSVMFITHDLRLAGDVCDDVAVLYAGRIVESGPAEEILSRPRHPYSRCLNLAAPELAGRIRNLYLLPKAMPSVRERAVTLGCDFAPRCPLAMPACETIKPPLDPVAPDHYSACLRAGDVDLIPEPPLVPDHGQGARGQDVVLRATGLGKTYQLRDWMGRGRQVEALRGLSFDVRDREFVGVVGESGSGKSTLTKLIVGLEDVTAGELELAGMDVRDPANHKRRDFLDSVQLVFQDPQSALNPRRRISSLITQSLEARPGLPSRAARDELTRDLLRKVKLTADCMERFPDQLSGGQKQRVNIARALCANPRLLIADEIVSGLDVSVQAQILELLRGLREEANFSLLLISHDLAVVRHVCDRALVMYKGEIVEQGPVEQVFGNPQHDYTRSLVAAASGGSA